MKKKKEIILLVAAGLNNEIGADNKMMWHLPDDFKWFKNHTMGHPMIMGRKTFESIGSKPLPGRTSIIISRYPQNIEGSVWYDDPSKALKEALKIDKTVYVIGGESVFRFYLDNATKIFLTRVNASFPEAEVHFPDFGEDEWIQTFAEQHPKDEKHKFDFEFQIWERK